MGGKTSNKAGYFDKLKGLLEEYRSIFIVLVDNVASQQMHEIRIALRGEGIVLMGKNTMVSDEEEKKEEEDRKKKKIMFPNGMVRNGTYDIGPMKWHNMTVANKSPPDSSCPQDLHLR